MPNNNMEDLINEAANIGLRFKQMAKNAPKDPYAVDRVVAIYQASGLSASEFVRRTRGFSASTLYMWSRGKGTNGQDWPALQAATARRAGAALAASMNANLGTPSSTSTTMIVPRQTATVPPGVRQVIRYEDDAGTIHETPEAARRANEARRVREAAKRFTDWLVSKSLAKTPDAMIDVLSDALLTDEAGKMMLAIVTGRFAFAA